MNYRRLFDGDRLRHVQLAVYMYQEPAGNHIFGVFCLLDREGGRTDKDKEQERAGQEAQGNEFAQLLSSVGDAACLIDPDTYELIEANQAYYRMIGMAEEDCRGRKCHELFYGSSKPCMFCNGFNWEWDRFSFGKTQTPGRA